MTVTLSAIDYYASHGCALFPMRAGSKAPVGIISSFVHDCSKDPATWQSWAAANPGCNFGVVAGASGLIIVDIDVKQGRDEAWAAWCSLCADWGVPVQMPHVATPSGGWHVYFTTDADPASLRQPDAIRGLINVRAGNGFTVAAGSTFKDVPYTLLSVDAPHPAPAALVEHCTRRAAPAANSAALGTRDPGDVAAMLRWMTERDAFAAYEDWLGAGMALRTEFGDAGRSLWALTHDATVTPDVEASKWASFSTNATGQSVTLNSLLARAGALGYRVSAVRKSTSAMFGPVAAIAAAAGASLPGPMPMVAGQQALCDIGAPLIAEFLAATADFPTRPANPDYPRIPETLSGHGLYEPLSEAIGRIAAMIASPGPFRGTRVIQPGALLHLVHQETADTLGRRAEAAGRTWPWQKIKLAANGIAEQVERQFVDQGDWHYDAKGQIESDNSDNVGVLLGVLGISVRYNQWLERAELVGWNWPEWTAVDDNIVAILRTRANRTKTRFRAGKDFFWDSLLALAYANPVDPALERLADLASRWDGTPRLAIWLSRACGTPCDLYHQAVARNIVGGMVRRIREPGCKHDEIAILYGPQGTGKSTLAAVLAPMAEWFSDEVMLGDESKELVLSLAGKCVIEVAEMGMRGSANTNHVKAMLSRTIDRGRTAYARTVTARARRNIFIGTTNDDDPLVDPTGNRRFLPVRVDSEVDLEWLRANVAQIIGEAARLHDAGASFAIPRNVWGIAQEHQEAARSASDLEIQLAAWFGETEFTATAFVTADDLVKACTRASLRAPAGARAAVMKRLGFRQEKPYLNGKRTQVWFRGPKNMLPSELTTRAVRYGVGSDTAGDVKVTIAGGR